MKAILGNWTYVEGLESLLQDVLEEHIGRFVSGFSSNVLLKSSDYFYTNYINILIQHLL